MLPLLLAFFFAPQDQPPPKCTISGVAVNAITGEPLGKVQVVAEGGGKNGPASMVSGPKGEFTLPNLEPGQYRLKGIRNGYLSTYYGARRAESMGIALTLEAGQESKDLQLKLLPFAVIAGTVRDPDGEALAGAEVAVSKLTYQEGRPKLVNQDTVKTDDLGQYRVAGLAPGRYYVRAAVESDRRAPGPETLVPTFHPVSRDLSGARRIDLAAGARFTGADITLIRSKTYHVRVHAEGPAGLGLGVSLHERPAVGDGLSISPPSACEKGVCAFAGVPSGSYEVSASASPQNLRGTMEELFFNNHEFRASVPVEVTNADVDGVRVTVSAGADVAGRVTLAGEDQPPQLHGRVNFLAADGGSFSAAIAEDGTFSTRLSLGTCQIEVYIGDDLVVRSIRSETTDVLADGLTITHAGKLPLEVVIGHDAGKVEGTVLDSDDKPKPGAIVVLIPKKRERHDLYATVETDQNGRYQLARIAPGDYQLFAWDDVEPGIWYDPEFLKDVESKGESVTVHAKGFEQVRLHVIR